MQELDNRLLEERRVRALEEAAQAQREQAEAQRRQAEAQRQQAENAARPRICGWVATVYGPVWRCDVMR
jgi:hypothetical protein